MVILSLKTGPTYEFFEVSYKQLRVEYALVKLYSKIGCSEACRVQFRYTHGPLGKIYTDCVPKALFTHSQFYIDIYLDLGVYWKLEYIFIIIIVPKCCRILSKYVECQN